MFTWASLVAQTVKNLCATREAWVRSLDWEDPLEKGIATQYTSILVWRIPWTSLVDYSPWGCKELDTTEQLSLCSVVNFLMKD